MFNVLPWKTYLNMEIKARSVPFHKLNLDMPSKTEVINIPSLAPVSKTTRN